MIQMRGWPVQQINITEGILHISREYIYCYSNSFFSCHLYKSECILYSLVTDLNENNPYTMFAAVIVNSILLVFAGCISPTLSVSTNSPLPVREVSHEDLRDAILSLVHMFRDNTDKLERHEYRERQLGEQLKKSLQTIEKKQKIDENGSTQLLDSLNVINGRLEKLETEFSKYQTTKLSIDSLASINNSLSQKLDNIAQVVWKIDLASNNLRSYIEPKLEAILINVLQTQSLTSTLEQKLAHAILSAAAGSVTENPVSAFLVNKFDTKLSQLDEHKDFLLNLSAQQQNLQEQVSEISRNLVQLVSTGHNGCKLNRETEIKLDELKNEIIYANENRSLNIREEIEKYHYVVNQAQKGLFTALSDTKQATTNYDELLKEIKSLSKIDQVLIQTADNVLDTKRRIEYGTHQILLEVGELIKSSTKETNETINRRFDVISSQILDNQNGALKNLSTKLETEISQVWRQIGIMYQTLTNSADALDKLQQQTEIYVNGSLSTMDSMEGKVGQITGRMSEVDENLNYLLGRLSLVTQEFNQIKTGLGQALDNIRSSFHTVQDKVKDVGPGPNPIPVEELGEGSLLKKTQYTVN